MEDREAKKPKKTRGARGRREEQEQEKREERRGRSRNDKREREGRGRGDRQSRNQKESVCVVRAICTLSSSRIITIHTHYIDTHTLYMSHIVCVCHTLLLYNVCVCVIDG
jgi:transcription termination factor Rho